MNSRDMDAIKSVMIEQRDEKMDRLERERNELLAALEGIVSVVKSAQEAGNTTNFDDELEAACIIIDKVKEKP